MRPRTEAVLGFGLLVGLMLVAGALGRARRPPYLGDPRASSLLAGPDGARGLADALRHLGIQVEAWRRRTRELALATPVPGRVAFVVLAPSQPLEPTELTPLLTARTGPASGTLVFAGPSAQPLMQCLGWGVGHITVRGRAVAPPGRRPDDRSAEVTLFLEPDATMQRTREDRRACAPVPTTVQDTLLRSGDGGVAAIRLRRDDTGQEVILVSDPRLLENRALRETSTGSDVLAWFAGRFDRVVFEEAHHGFGPSGSLAGAVLAWSRGSPWGWAVWQAAIVGILALCAGAIRFGPVRQAIPRSRRSPLEHVHALATALAAARGHDVAIRATVRGLRRRVTAGRAAPGPPGAWLQEFAAHAPGPRARAAAETLQRLSVPGQPAAAVLTAANTVEDLWQELHP